MSGDDIKPGVNHEQRVRLWNAINAYTKALGGDPSKHVYGNIQRMAAVAGIEAVVRELCDQPQNEPAQLRALQVRVVELETELTKAQNQAEALKVKYSNLIKTLESIVFPATATRE